MSLPDIQFGRIREHEGSRDRAFEELCCQLAALEPRPAGSAFYRKGRGRDAGLECFLRCADGDEVGWQAKYYWAMDASLTGSLSMSLDSALRRHPRLKHFIVCIPFDLPNPGGAEDLGAIGKWESWKKIREDEARAKGRTLAIELWTASTLKERLIRGGVLGIGRILFWFSEQPLSAEWAKARLETTLADLGKRYTAESHVNLPIRRALLGLSRSPVLWIESRKWNKALQPCGDYAVRACSSLEHDAESPLPCDLAGALDALRAALGEPPPEAHEPTPVGKWKQQLAVAQDAVARTFRWWMDCGCTAGSEKEQNEARYWLAQVRSGLGKVEEALDDPLWRHVDDQAVIVIGEGGVGKSHLLADAARCQIDKGLPAVLLLGQHFVDGDPWPQITKGLDLPQGTTADHFLGALDAAAEATGVRGLLIIDALNEKHGLDLWPDRLAGPH